ncbi:hypothetical protein [Methylomonas koyamae]|uniref:hypothetical protein n=1 Tax=Methylomonas koyamae TaxID=702114 RepID=UPI0018E0894A|nr:hypothetical protein [Methylomonas koyamae]
MKKSSFAFVCFALSMLQLGRADAGVLHFDDVTADAEAAIADGYAGLNWTNFWVQNPQLGQVANFDSGFYHGVVSADYGAFNADGGPAGIWSNSLFDFRSGYFASASRWGMQITANGYRDGNLLYQQQLLVNTDAAQFFSLNFAGIDSLEFVASGGEEYLGAGFHFTLDNADIAAPVPLPAAAWLLGSALAGLLGLQRRKG